ncbi:MULTISPECIES: hypothetical protein [unclassified Bradyrhizobium]|uniref:hypothetical protein n=1 Tax=unclassified Bradyrhizobium TaxID=2631580 RepID=UPI0028E5D6D5|nr:MULTISPECIES: hypothetical protein [unclassified Bradyrhizobium]
MIQHPIPMAGIERFWGAAAVLAIGLAIALYALGVGSNPNELFAAVSVNYKEFTVSGLSCLSIDPRKVVFDRKEYWDDSMTTEVANRLSIKEVMINADYTACRWGLTASILSDGDPAVTFNGDAAQYLVSIAVCKRDPDGSMMASYCVNKNIYVFNRQVAARDLFTLALVGLARPQVDKWETFTGKRLQ